MGKIKYISANGGGSAQYSSVKNTHVFGTRTKPCPALAHDLVPAKIHHSSGGFFDFKKMAEDAAKIEKHIENGGKLKDLSEYTFDHPKGLFDK